MQLIVRLLYFIETNKEIMKNEARFNEVTKNLKSMFKCASKSKKDDIVKSLKSWLKSNTKTEDKGKLDAIKCFLADNNIF